tara:strand:- start:2810 stop:3913 length:1104 start_codon:yes stop_codon:yes gene_type:complete
MEPVISNISYEEDVYKFTLSKVHLSYANAIRRTILSDIPIVGVYTETHAENQCNIEVNTCRLHNEILKQRLSCIPIHITDLDVLPGNYELILDVTNDTDNIMMVTTEHFKIRSKTSDNYLTEGEMNKIFPKNNKTGMYIDFARLRPKIDTNINGEQIKLVADFSIQTAKKNSMFNVVSICSYGNTIDTIKANKYWEEQEKKLRSEQLLESEIIIQKKDFYLLDAQRHSVNESYDFIVQSIGIYSNKELIKKSCDILENKFIQMSMLIENDEMPIVTSETTMDNCYDIILENEDYTMGTILEYVMYINFYEKEQVLSFCGFKKMHPHDDDSILRLAFSKNVNNREIGQYLNKGCTIIIETIKNIKKLF